MSNALIQAHHMLDAAANAFPDSPAVFQGNLQCSYAELSEACQRFAQGSLDAGLKAGDRIAVFLPKQLETVIAIFGSSVAGGTFVPINPVLKAPQVMHIVNDCDVKILITSRQRWAVLQETLGNCSSLTTVVIVDATSAQENRQGEAQTMLTGSSLISWDSFTSKPGESGHRRIDKDMAAILYTSGSTGKPKGVVLSHRNLIAGAESVSSYLENTAADRILAALPLSFDAGLSQLTTAFYVGASVILMDYLLPRDVLKAIDRFGITGLAAVPPLWNQLVRLKWPETAAKTLRYITNTGGSMPVSTTRELRTLLPKTQIYLMYGLTEAFRSTYLPPGDVDAFPDSIGMAIPNAKILVINESGEECQPGEPGELVHRGSLVAMGYWNDPEKTSQRFRPVPCQDSGLPMPELAVWSGDQVIRNAAGYLYFVSRNDDMIKTSGYRVSPSEVEEEAYVSGLVAEAAAFGAPHPMLGQGIVLAAVGVEGSQNIEDQLKAALAKSLPNFMQPKKIVVLDALPHNPNGKIDRRGLSERYADSFATETNMGAVQ